jgi:hypothetical protein
MSGSKSAARDREGSVVSLEDGVDDEEERGADKSIIQVGW